MSNSIGLYVHIPFCAKKCLYCDFTSYAGVLAKQYVYKDAIIKEMGMRANMIGDKRISTIFIGGGTPSIIDTAVINAIIDEVRKNFHVEQDAEVTIEINPGTVNAKSLTDYRAMGINRLSIGLQAWQDELLKAIGRIHTSAEFVDSYNEARKAGFDNINVDLMFGLPQQTIGQWIHTLQAVVSLGPEHISCYDLQIEEGTRMYKMVADGDIKPLDEDADRLMYKTAVELLGNEGYERYEVSNFAKPGFRCRHNLNYWYNGHYVGLGCAAHSYLNHIRWANMSGLQSYIDTVSDDNIPMDFEEYIDHDTEMFETMMLGLRTSEGVNKKLFEERFGIQLYQRYGHAIDKLSAMGLMCDDESAVKVSDKGMDVLNSVLVEFLP
ncbi:radical SAM family heme chaperone HemW [Mahella sp.]|uniref:radical SAM family heme chaperone HemW n=1 Tax=Mahella sp. TaxID=2798721 RepID=UPI0025C02229|nr:radical SAM family heme chaperone HemW [Mahella sp.]MBZ4666048.1 oxygen-independent coproporphyrinogen oxidase [Mahella sp.]MDK2902745.1 hypothetical protein [Clostridiales bacterium]